MTNQKAKNVPRGTTELQQVAGKLKARRLFLGLTQQKVAELSETSWPFVLNLETGKAESVQTAKLEQVCKVLNMSLSELFASDNTG